MDHIRIEQDLYKKYVFFMYLTEVIICKIVQSKVKQIN